MEAERNGRESNQRDAAVTAAAVQRRSSDESDRADAADKLTRPESRNRKTPPSRVSRSTHGKESPAVSLPWGQQDANELIYGDPDNLRSEFQRTEQEKHQRLAEALASKSGVELQHETAAAEKAAEEAAALHQAAADEAAAETEEAAAAKAAADAAREAAETARAASKGAAALASALCKKTEFTIAE